MFQPLELVLGEDATLDLRLQVDGAPPTGGIAGWSLAWRVFAWRGDPDDAALLALASDDGAIAVWDDAAGIARLHVTKEQAATLGAGRYFHRLTSLDRGGRVEVPAHGWLTVSR